MTGGNSRTGSQQQQQSHQLRTGPGLDQLLLATGGDQSAQRRNNSRRMGAAAAAARVASIEVNARGHNGGQYIRPYRQPAWGTRGKKLINNSQLTLTTTCDSSMVMGSPTSVTSTQLPTTYSTSSSYVTMNTTTSVSHQALSGSVYNTSSHLNPSTTPGSSSGVASDSGNFYLPAIGSALSSEAERRSFASDGGFGELDALGGRRSGHSPPLFDEYSEAAASSTTNPAAHNNEFADIFSAVDSTTMVGLGDDDPTLVEAVSGNGYRFVTSSPSMADLMATSIGGSTIGDDLSEQVDILKSGGEDDPATQSTAANGVHSLFADDYSAAMDGVAVNSPANSESAASPTGLGIVSVLRKKVILEERRSPIGGPVGLRASPTSPNGPALVRPSPPPTPLIQLTGCGQSTKQPEKIYLHL